MATNTQKQNVRKAKKQKQRREKIRKQGLASQAAPKQTIEQQVDMALAMVDQGHVKAGTDLLEQVRRKHDRHPLVQYGLGVVALAQKKYDDAVGWFEEAVMNSPEFIEAHFNLAVAYQCQRNLPGMIVAYRHVLDHGETGSLAVRKAAENLAQIEKGLREREGVGLAEFLEGHDHFHRGLDHMSAKEWDLAIDALNQSLRVHPGSVQSHGNMGICYAVQGKKKEALAALNRALELDPGYEPALLHRNVVEALDDGEAMGDNVTVIDYYKDYAHQSRSGGVEPESTPTE